MSIQSPICRGLALLLSITEVCDKQSRSSSSTGDSYKSPLAISRSFRGGLEKQRSLTVTDISGACVGLRLAAFLSFDIGLCRGSLHRLVSFCYEQLSISILRPSRKGITAFGVAKYVVISAPLLILLFEETWTLPT